MTEEEPEEVTDPLTRGKSSDRSDTPVDLETVPGERCAAGEAETESAPPLDAEPRPGPGDKEAEFGEEPEFEGEPGFGRGDVFGHDPGQRPGPRLAPGPKPGPGHHPGPPHEHGLGPKKDPPAKKVPGKKVPGKKVPGPKKHPGHQPGPPHERHPEPPHEHGPGSRSNQRDFELGYDTDPGFDYGFGFGRGGNRGPRQGHGRRHRGRPGDVRAAILALLTEKPMHGYEMIQEIAKRTRDVWRPSPGSVYPTLQLLDDEGLVTGSQSEGSRRFFELTEEGRTAAAKITTPPWEEVGKSGGTHQADLRGALSQLVGAVAQAAQAATAAQQQRVVDIVNTARRKIYSLLAGE